MEFKYKGFLPMTITSKLSNPEVKRDDSELWYSAKIMSRGDGIMTPQLSGILVPEGSMSTSRPNTLTDMLTSIEGMGRPEVAPIPNDIWFQPSQTISDAIANSSRYGC